MGCALHFFFNKIMKKFGYMKLFHYICNEIENKCNHGVNILL